MTQAMRQIKLVEAGKFYINGRGDVCGPMEERAPGTWLDQHGAVYHPDGKEWNHVEGSTANLVREAAAPDLSDAARKARWAIEALIGLHGPDPAGMALYALNALDTAIAKAEGPTMNDIPAVTAEHSQNDDGTDPSTTPTSPETK